MCKGAAKRHEHTLFGYQGDDKKHEDTFLL